MLMSIAPISVPRMTAATMTSALHALADRDVPWRTGTGFGLSLATGC